MRRGACRKAKGLRPSEIQAQPQSPRHQRRNMPICPGGLTQPRPGISQFINLGSSGTGLLSQIPRLAKLGPLSAALGVVSLATDALCAQEPPPIPTFTQAEVNALLQMSFGPDYFSGLVKLRDTLTNLAWYQFCQCTTGGSTPALPLPPVQPSPPATMPGAPQNTSVQCYTFGPNVETWKVSFSDKVNANLFNWGLVTNPVGGSLTIQTAPVAPGAGSTTHWSIDGYWEVSGQFRNLQTFTLQATDSKTITLPYDPTFTRILFTGTMDTRMDPGETVTWSGFMTCASGAPVGPANCCPPDPAMLARLDSVLQTVTLLQRQLVPFSYVSGAVHAGLSGAGVIPIQGLLGMKIQCTALPIGYGKLGTSPQQHFDLGYVTFGTADGYPTSYRVHHDPQLELPARCSAYTTLAYDLAPGVVITATEIKREV